MSSYTKQIFDEINQFEYKYLKKIVNFKRSKLRILYFKLNNLQQNQFNRIYGSLREVNEKDLPNAIRICATTIEKNTDKENVDSIFDE